MYGKLPNKQDLLKNKLKVGHSAALLYDYSLTVE